MGHICNLLIVEKSSDATQVRVFYSNKFKYNNIRLKGLVEWVDKIALTMNLIYGYRVRYRIGREYFARDCYLTKGRD